LLRLNAQGIAIRGDGSLVVSQGNFAAIIDGSSGAEIRKLGSGVGQFQMANGIAILASGEIAVTDSLANQVKALQSRRDKPAGQLRRPRQRHRPTFPALPGSPMNRVRVSWPWSTP